MNRNINHDNLDELLKKYHAGTITPEEYARLMESIHTTPDSELRGILQQQWEDFNEYTELSDKKMSELYNKGIKPRISVPFYIHIRHYWMQLAASLLILIMGGLTVKFYTENQAIYQLAERPITIYAGKTGKSSVTLPDGTRVRLNAKSELSYRQDFGQRDRRVSLNGEGYFEVKRDETKQFVVSTEVMDITVLGTIFNVYAYENKDFVEMTLVEGHVQVTPYNHPEQTIDVQPNEKVIYERSTGKVSLQRTSSRLETIWLENELVFRQDKLKDVFASLERKFGVVIQTNNLPVLNDKYTGTFGDEKLENILKVLQIHYGFKYKIEDGIVSVN